MKKRIVLLCAVLLCIAVLFVACKEDVHQHTVVIDPAIAPTCTTDGRTEGAHCSTCNAILLAPTAIPATGHQYSREWSTDDTYHWRVPTCTDTEEIAEKGMHRFDNGAVTTAPTCAAEGVKTYTCQDCLYTKTEPIAQLTAHAFSNVWTVDATHHWHASVCGCQDQVQDKGTHRFDTGAITTQPTCSQTGIKTYTCQDCSYQKIEPVPATNAHTYATTWSSNATHHWHAATCGCALMKDVAVHRFDAGTITKPPTSTETGTKTVTCKDCSLQQIQTIPATLVPQLYDTTYSGKTCTIWQGNPSYYGPRTDFYVSEDAPRTTAVDRASYQRLQAIKEKAGITIRVVKSTDHSATLGSPDIGTLKEIFNTPATRATYDIIIPGSHTACQLMADGYLCALKGLYSSTVGDIAHNYLDFSKNCWDTQINDALSIGDEYYMVSGDFSVANAARVTALFIDKYNLATINTALLAGTAAADYTGIESIYSWVRNGTWTWQKMMALAEAFTGEAGDVANQRYGLAYQATSSYSVFLSTGRKYMDKDSNGKPIYEINSDANQKAMAWLVANVQSAPTTYIWGGGTGNERVHEEFGPEHHTLFSVMGYGQVSTYANVESNFDFTVVPMPKLDYSDATINLPGITQSKYSGTIAAWFVHVAAIPKTAADTSFSSFVLQLMAEMGSTTYMTDVQTVKEAYIEEGMQGNNLPQDLKNNPDLVEIIFDSATVDLGEVFPWTGVMGSIGDQVRAYYNRGNVAGLTTLQQTYGATLNSQINALLRNLGLVS